MFGFVKVDVLHPKRYMFQIVRIDGWGLKYEYSEKMNRRPREKLDFSTPKRERVLQTDIVILHLLVDSTSAAVYLVKTNICLFIWSKQIFSVLLHPIFNGSVAQLD